MDFHYLPIEDEVQEKIEELGRGGDGYRVVEGGSELTQYGVPEGIARKTGSAVVVTKSIGSETTLVVVNNNRLDPKQGEIDQHPWAVLIRTTGADTEGVLGDHGDWNDRTVAWEGGQPSSDFTTVFGSTDMGKYIPDRTMPRDTSGPLREIENTGHYEAFNCMLDQIDSQLSSNPST